MPLKFLVQAVLSGNIFSWCLRILAQSCNGIDTYQDDILHAIKMNRYLQIIQDGNYSEYENKFFTDNLLATTGNGFYIGISIRCSSRNFFHWDDSLILSRDIFLKDTPCQFYFHSKGTFCEHVSEIFWYHEGETWAELNLHHFKKKKKIPGNPRGFQGPHQFDFKFPCPQRPKGFFFVRDLFVKYHVHPALD